MSEPRPYMHPTADITLNGSATAVTNDVGAPYSGTSTNMVINLKDIFDGCSIQCITTSSLAVKVYVSMDFGTTFEPAVSVDQAGAMTAADSAVTPSAGDTISWNCSNATHVRISRTAGSGTVKFKAWTGSPPVTTVVGMGTVAGTVSSGRVLTNNHAIGTLTTMLSTQLNALASAGVSALSSAFDNSAGLYNMADFEAFLDYQASPTAGTQVELYICPSLDATNYADGGDATLINASHYVGGFTLRAVTDPPQRITLRNIRIPFSNFKVHVKNSGGQAMIAADTNTIKMLPYRVG